MKAFELFGQSIMLGKTDAAVAVGFESMSQALNYLAFANFRLKRSC